MLRVVCLCSCVFCRVSLSSFWVVLELVLAHQSSQWLSCFYPGSLLATLVFFVECLGGVATRALGSLPFYSLLALFPKVRGHQSTQALLPSLFPVLDLLVHVLHFISSPWLSPLFSVIASSLPLLLPFFFFINFQFRFNLVVGSLLSPLYLCNTPSKSVMYWLGREMKKHLYLLEIDQAKMVTNKSW
jgi:hypothetical protein